MRRTVIALLGVAAACGDNHAVRDDGNPGDAAGTCTAVRGTNVSLRRVAAGCNAPDAPSYPGCIDGTATLVTAPRGDDRQFIIEQVGRLRIMEHDRLLPEPFLDIVETADPPLVAVSELGLLGLAFHPQFATNGTFFVYYTSPNSANPQDPYFDLVMRYTTSVDPYKADPDSGVVVLAIPDFAGNHNGGMIEFGPDGFLYIGTGDGGIAADPHRTGQDPSALLGKILRIDVDTRLPGKEYGIPGDNPFAAGGGAPEVFISGARNPWRFSFDRQTGDLWIADVGQDRIEELNVLRAGEQAGKNLGWSSYEGSSCFRMPCAPAGLTMPAHERTHAEGWCSIIGGQVYRGTCFPDLAGKYFFTDFCAHGLSTAELRSDGSLEVVDLPGTFPKEPTSIYDDARGELYLTDTKGSVYHIEARP